MSTITKQTDRPVLEDMRPCNLRAYEFPAMVTPGGNVELPDIVSRVLAVNQTIRVIILVNEPSSLEEGAWAHLTAKQFLAGYSEADSIYDRI